VQVQDPGTLELVAELAIAVLGFSGVVAAFGRRSLAEWSELERIRFKGMIKSASQALILALLPFPFISAGLPGVEVWRWSSALGGIFVLVSVLPELPRVRRARLWSNPEVSKATMVFGISAGYGGPLLLLLNATGSPFSTSFTPYLVAVLLIFGGALASFIRLVSSISAEPPPSK
jgi:hypothetical protein